MVLPVMFGLDMSQECTVRPDTFSKTCATTQQAARCRGCRRMPSPGSAFFRIVLLAIPFLSPGLAGCPRPQAERSFAGEPSARPGINDAYRNADVDKWLDRFESESREIYVNREQLLDLLNLRPGMDVADVGAGTGFMAMMMAESVGPAGTVYAVDISAEFISYIQRRAETAALENVQTVHCTQRSTELPPQSIDLAFICDTYHHFEHPASTMKSLLQALRPGGEVVVVDFKRIPGVSREWVLNHVRAGREVVIHEIVEAGFELIPDEIEAPFLEENYLVRFRKRGRIGNSPNRSG